MPSLGIAPLPGVAAGTSAACRRGRHRLQASFRRVSELHLPEIGLQAIQLSPYHADLPARRPIRLDPAAGFLACYFPRLPFRGRV